MEREEAEKGSELECLESGCRDLHWYNESIVVLFSVNETRCTVYSTCTLQRLSSDGGQVLSGLTYHIVYIYI